MKPLFPNLKKLNLPTLSPTLLAALNRLALAQLAAHGHLSPRQLQRLSTPAPQAAPAATPASACRPGPRHVMTACCA